MDYWIVLIGNLGRYDMGYILLSFVWWQILSATVISSGYHRYFAHRAFRASKWYEYYVLFLGTLTASGPLLGWVGVHRMHHNHTDTEEDPHSPRHQGFIPVLTSTFKVKTIKHRVVKDLLRNPRVMWFYRNHMLIRSGTLFFGLVLTPFPVFLALFIAPMIYAYIGFGTINAFAHKDGKIHNSWWLNILSAGEGYHKNHHENPRAWKLGRYDPTALFIRLIKK